MGYRKRVDEVHAELFEEIIASGVTINNILAQLLVQREVTPALVRRIIREHLKKEAS